MPVLSNNGYYGWPSVNHAVNVRNASTSDAEQGRMAIALPRRKFTYLVQFNINPSALESSSIVSNFPQFYSNGKIYAHLTSIGLPNINYIVDTLRSANKDIKVVKRAEFPASQMRFHNDSTSMVESLKAEYDNFYQYRGDIGYNLAGNNLTSAISENNAFKLGTEIVAPNGETIRSDMEYRPSIGMRLRPDAKQYFFENIIVYDLGTEPDSVNVHYFYHPVITSFDTDELDYNDGSGLLTTTATFEYENYYTVLGQNRNQLKEVFGAALDFFPEGDASPSYGHAETTIPQNRLGERVNNTSNSILPGTGPTDEIAVEGMPWLTNEVNTPTSTDIGTPLTSRPEFAIRDDIIDSERSIAAYDEQIENATTETQRRNLQRQKSTQETRLNQLKSELETAKQRTTSMYQSGTDSASAAQNTQNVLQPQTQQTQAVDTPRSESFEQSLQKLEKARENLEQYNAVIERADEAEANLERLYNEGTITSDQLLERQQRIDQTRNTALQSYDEANEEIGVYRKKGFE